MSEKPQQGKVPSSGGISTRTVLAIVIGIVALLFIVLNRDHTEISFILFSASAPLWLALGMVAACGFAAGYFLARRNGKN